MTRRLSGLLVLAICTGLSIWAAMPEVLDQWVDTGDRESFENVLVVAVTDDEQVRLRFEDRMVSHLRTRGYKARTSHSLVENIADPGDLTAVVAKLIADDVEAAIVFRPLPVKKGEELEPSAEWQGSFDRYETVRQFVRESLPLARKSGKRLSMEMTVWAVDSRLPVFAARTGVHKGPTFRDNIGELTQQLIYALRASEVL